MFSPAAREILIRLFLLAEIRGLFYIALLQNLFYFKLEQDLNKTCDLFFIIKRNPLKENPLKDWHKKE